MKRLIINIITVVVVLFAGFVGVTFFFSDYGLGETIISRLLVAFVYYFIFGLLVSLLSFPNRKAAFFLLWGIGMVLLLSLPQALKAGGNDLLQLLVMILIPSMGVYVAQKAVHVIKQKV